MLDPCIPRNVTEVSGSNLKLPKILILGHRLKGLNEPKHIYHFFVSINYMNCFTKTKLCTHTQSPLKIPYQIYNFSHRTLATEAA